MATKRTPKVTHRDDEELSELEQLRLKVAELEAAAGKTPRRKKGPFEDIAQQAFEDEPHWDPRITRYYAQGSADLRDMKRESSWTLVNDTRDYVVNGVHLRHVGAWDEVTSAGKGVKPERQTFRIVEVLK